MAEELVMIDDGVDMMEAEILRSMLEAYGIQVLLSEEAAGAVFGVTSGPLGQVEVWVRTDQAEAARQLLQAYRSGELPSAPAEG